MYMVGALESGKVLAVMCLTALQEEVHFQLWQLLKTWKTKSVQEKHKNVEVSVAKGIGTSKIKKCRPSWEWLEEVCWGLAGCFSISLLFSITQGY